MRYDARRYWNRRFEQHGPYRAAGHHRVSEAANESAYLADWIRLNRLLPPARSVLEIGPGSGFYTERLSRLYGSVSCLEVSDVAAESLRGRGFDVIRGDICEFRPDRVWDLVVMIEVVQHIVSRKAFHAAMQNLRSIVGAYLVIGALTEGRSWRTARHVHQWSMVNVTRASGLIADEAVDFRSGKLWRFKGVERYATTDA